MSQNSSFAAKQFSTINNMLENGQSTSVIGIPGCGISVFLKQLALQPYGKIVNIDVFSLPALSAQEFFNDLLEQLGGSSKSKNLPDLVHACQNQLAQILKNSDEKIIIIISGFDKLAKDFSNDFFRYLRSLHSLDQSKIIFVFGICRRLETILPPGLTNLDLRLLSNKYYLKRYSESDLRHLLDSYGPNPAVDDQTFREMVRLSGGHFQFLQLLLQSEYRQTPTEDPFIKLSFENIWSHLSSSQKTALRKVAAGGTYTKPDPYLTNVGLVVQKGKKFELFSPLFADCITAATGAKLPVKERRLLAILKRNEGKVVLKQEIYDAIWRGQEVGSEWALNALVYRLRKHPAFVSQNYTIENHKKVGYLLKKNA